MIEIRHYIKFKTLEKGPIIEIRHYIKFNPKRAGLFGPISQPGEGADSAPPPRSRKPIDEISSVCGTSG